MASVPPAGGSADAALVPETFPPLDRPERPEGAPAAGPAWPMRSGALALLVALTGAVLFGAAIAVVFALFGQDVEGPGFSFASAIAQELTFVGAALLLASRSGPVRASDFGLRPFRPVALLWMGAAMVSYIAFAAAYSAVFKPPQDDLPQTFGADTGTALAIATGILVIAVAPLVEEFFFRGFVYASFRNRLGVWGGALASGLVFGAIHLKLEFLVPLAILGAILALLYEKTGSIWPCVLMHALNNALAFAVTV